MGILIALIPAIAWGSIGLISGRMGGRTTNLNKQNLVDWDRFRVVLEYWSRSTIYVNEGGRHFTDDANFNWDAAGC